MTAPRPFHGPKCEADPREGQDFDWTERPSLSAVGDFEPASICTQPGEPGSSPACASCTASCSAEPADVDPAEAEHWLDRSLWDDPLAFEPGDVIGFNRYSFATWHGWSPAEEAAHLASIEAQPDLFEVVEVGGKLSVNGQGHSPIETQADLLGAIAAGPRPWQDAARALADFDADDAAAAIRREVEACEADEAERYR